MFSSQQQPGLVAEPPASARQTPATSFSDPHDSDSASNCCLTHRRPTCKKARKKHVAIPAVENAPTYELVFREVLPGKENCQSAANNSASPVRLADILQKTKELEGRVQIQERQLADTKKEAESREREVSQLNRDLDRCTEELKVLKNANREKDSALRTKTEEMKSFALKLSQREQQLAEKTEEADNATRKLGEEKKEFERLLASLTRKEREVETRERELGEMRKLLRQKELVLAEKENVQRKMSESLRGREEELRKGRIEADEKVRFCKEKESELDQRETSIRSQLRIVENLDLKVLGLKMNEELWIKKKELQNRAIIDGFARLKDKERELKEKTVQLRNQQSVRKSVSISSETKSNGKVD